LTSETARVEAFSLILEIKAPSVGSGDLGEQLLRQWPSYLSFFISFAYVGVMWINHRRLSTHIRKSDDVLLVLNLLLLLRVTVVPFPTSVLAAHLGHPGARTALIVYNAVYLSSRFCSTYCCAMPRRKMDASWRRMWIAVPWPR